MTRVENPNHLLVWDGLVLASPFQDFTADGFKLETMGADWDYGNPVPVDAVIDSMLIDGDLTRTTRDGNREAKFTVTVTAAGDDGIALGLGEAALMAKRGKRNTLVWTPPQAGALPAVLDVQTSRVDIVPDDIDELRNLRTYTITLTCLPWVRAASPTTADFSATSVAAPTTLDDCSTATRWSVAAASPQTATSVATTTYSGDTAIQVNAVTQVETYSNYGGSGGTAGTANVFRATAAWSVPTGISTNYVAFDLLVNPALTYGAAQVTGSPGLTLVSVTTQSTGYRRYIYKTVSPLTTSANVFINFTGQSATAVSTPMAAGYIGGVFQVASPLTTVFTTWVGGAVRTPGSVTISRTAALGHVTLYSDASLLSAPWSPDNLDTWWAAPAGTYAVWVDCNNAATASSATVVINGQSVTGSWTAAAAIAAGTWVPLGNLTLTQRRDGTLGGAAGGVTVTRGGTTVTSSTAVGGRVRIFRKSNETSFIHVPSLAASDFTVDSPSVDYPYGFLSSGGTAIDMTQVMRDHLVFYPGQCGLFIDIDNPNTSTVTRTLTYYKRAHTNMAETA